jgi:nuclear pore complex protein Nup160
VRDDENQSARLWANVLQYAVDARDWRAAYCAATSTAGDHRQAAAMRRLVASACEPGAKNGGAVLSTLCLDDTTDGSHYETIVNALEGRAATAPITPHAAPSDILYGFYLSRGKPANAAVAMYDFAARLRLRVSEVVRDPAMTYEELVAALARHSSALLASANALATLSDPCLVNFDKTPEDEVMEGNEDLSTVNVVSSGLDTKKSPLAEVLRAHALSAARLELLHAGCEIRALCLLNGDDQGDQGDASSVPSVCDSLIEYGCFQAATTLSTAWLNGEKLTSKLAVIAGTMAARAALAQIGDPSAADDAPYRKWQTVATEARGTKGLIGVDAPASSVDVYWNELRAFVERFDTLERNFAIAEASARAVLAVDARIALPKWLVERFINTPCLFSGGGMGRRGANPAALLRVYLSFDLVEDAARLALRELSTWSRRSAVDRTAHSAVWFPMDLMLEARDRCARDERLEHLRLALTTAIESHESRLKADTAMLTQVSA